MGAYAVPSLTTLILGNFLLWSYAGCEDTDGCDGKRCLAVTLSAEKILTNQLIEMYTGMGRSGRPVKNSSTAVPVEFGLGLIQMDLDEKYKVLIMSMWSRYKWKDEFLMWDPALYDGVEKVRLQPELIWVPDIMLYNTADPHDKAREDVLAVVQYDGSVLWVPHQIFKSSCSIDVTNFPFDSQSCHMWFGSWTYSRQEVDVEMGFPSGIDLSTFQSDFKDSSEWEILQTVAEKKIMPSVNDTPNYAVLTFQLDMKRKVVFSSYILTLPCVFLACLTLVVFWLPPDRPDRTALAMSIFASFLLLLLILVEAAPPTASSVPVLGVYYCFNLVIIMTAVFLSTLVVNICRAGEGTNPVPRWLKMITIDFLSRVFCMRGSLFSNEEFANLTPEQAEQVYIRRMSLAPAARAVPAKPHRPGGGGGGGTQIPCSRSQTGEFERSYRGYMPIPNGGTSGVVPPPDIASLVEAQVSEMRGALDTIRNNIYHRNALESRLNGIAKQWRDVAMVMDRLFFLIYLIIIAMSLIFLFPRPS